VRDERDELVLEAVRLAQTLVLLGQKTLSRLGLGAREPLGLAQAIERADEAGEPRQHEGRQRRGAGGDCHCVDPAA